MVATWTVAAAVGIVRTIAVAESGATDERVSRSEGGPELAEEGARPDPGDRLGSAPVCGITSSERFSHGLSKGGKTGGHESPILRAEISNEGTRRGRELHVRHVELGGDVHPIGRLVLVQVEALGAG